MTVFIAHAGPDLAAAEALGAFLERRGLFVELEDGETAFRPLHYTDVVVSLVSKDSAFSPWRLRHDRRALEAWAEQKLVLVKLDHHFAPVGLRDLPAIDASFEAQRDIAWAAVAKEIADMGKPPAPVAEAQSDEEAAPRPAPSPETGAPPRSEAPAKARGGPGVALAMLLMLPGIGAALALGAIWLANRIGPAPGTWADALRGLDALGARVGLPSGLGAPLALAAMALTALLVFLLLVSAATAALRGAGRAPSARKKAAAPQAAANAAPPPDEAVFISYARANSSLVLPVVEAVERLGRNLWLDQKGVVAGDGWAGEIVRAIRGSQGVCVMCSSAAFESDHVKREVYLADRYKKPLLPVFIEAAEPPEDFEYFFASVQQLRLYETPEAERANALAAALGGAPA
ncbi:MAG: TIR domain-containing protein [Hyphomonadaceae bacterium]